MDDELDVSDYAEGFASGYAQALRDLLNDECMTPDVVEAREWMSKKERRVNS